MSNVSDTRIGFIGLGAMGNPMAANFVAKGYKVYVLAASEESVARFCSSNPEAIGCKSVKEVATNSDYIFCSLPNGKVVSDVMLGADGIFENVAQGTVVVDTSSVDPGTSIKLSRKAEEYGIDYLDAPVSGGVKGAQNGTLTIMVGGKESVFKKVHDVFNVIGKNIMYIGEAGAGDTMKIVNNLMLGCNMAAMAEALNLGRKFGLSIETMDNIVSISSGRSYVSDNKIKNFIMDGNYDGGFAIALQHKDLRLALDAANDIGAPLMMGSIATQVFELAKEKGYSRKDISSVYDMLSEF